MTNSLRLWTWLARLLCPWGFSRQGYWSGLSCPPPGDLPNPGIEPISLLSPAWAGGLFTTQCHLGRPKRSQLSHYLIIVVDSTTEKNRKPKKTLKQEDSEWSGRLLRNQHFHWALKNTSLFTGWRKMRQDSVGAESCQNGRNGVSQSPETERNLEQWKALRMRVAH